MFIEFLLTSVIVILLPGTGVLYTVAIGLGRGFSASCAAALGCTLGIVPAAVASIAGLAALLHVSSLLFQTIRFLGVVYLLYMAWSILKEDGALSVSENKEPCSLTRVAINGTLLNILNPKLTLFFLAFLPQFLPVDVRDPAAAMMLLAVVFMVMTFVIFIAYGAFASGLRDYVITRPSALLWLRRSFATAFGVLGVKLAFTET